MALITPINALITFRGVPRIVHNVTRRIFPPIFPAGHETTSWPHTQQFFHGSEAVADLGVREGANAPPYQFGG